MVSHSIFWISYFACTETMASTGARKSEMVTAGLWQGTECISQADLVWVIDEKMVYDPTHQQMISR